jgi:hypothetical protein
VINIALIDAKTLLSLLIVTSIDQGMLFCHLVIDIEFALRSAY